MDILNKQKLLIEVVIWNEYCGNYHIVRIMDIFFYLFTYHASKCVNIENICIVCSFYLWFLKVNDEEHLKSAGVFSYLNQQMTFLSNYISYFYNLHLRLWYH